MQRGGVVHSSIKDNTGMEVFVYVQAFMLSSYFLLKMSSHFAKNNKKTTRAEEHFILSFRICLSEFLEFSTAP